MNEYISRSHPHHPKLTKPALRHYISSRVTFSTIYQNDSPLVFFLLSVKALLRRERGWNFLLIKISLASFEQNLRSILTKLICCIWPLFQVKWKFWECCARWASLLLPHWPWHLVQQHLIEMWTKPVMLFCILAWLVSGYYSNAELSSIKVEIL